MTEDQLSELRAIMLVLVALLRDLRPRDPDMLRRVMELCIPDVAKQPEQVHEAAYTIFAMVDLAAPAPEGAPKH